MESEQDRPDGSDDVDPQVLLSLLGDVQSAATAESLWPPNSLWHGPLGALMIWGIQAFSWEPTGLTGLFGLAVALVSFYFSGFQYARQRKV